MKKQCHFPTTLLWTNIMLIVLSPETSMQVLKPKMRARRPGDNSRERGQCHHTPLSSLQAGSSPALGGFPQVRIAKAGATEDRVIWRGCLRETQVAKKENESDWWDGKEGRISPRGKASAHTWRVNAMRRGIRKVFRFIEGRLSWSVP